MNTHILFALFFFISVIHPLNIQNINLYFAMMLFILIGVIFLITLYKNQTWKKLLEKYKLEIMAITLFLLINIISTSINYETFIYNNNFIQFALPSIAVWLLFPMTWVIFSENNYKNLQLIGWSVILIIGLVALWQLINIQSAYSLTQYFIGGIISREDVTSLTHLQNEYANIAAISILSLVVLLLKKNSFCLKNFSFYHALILLLFLTGFLTGSRIFTFILFITICMFFFRYFLHKPKIMLFLAFINLIIFHLFASSNIGTMSKYADIFPYLKKINTENKFIISDFIPHIDNQSLNGRAKLWQRSIKLWIKHKYFGIGTGGYRASLKGGKINTHNYYLQVLTETGVTGFISIIVLVFLLVKRSIQSKNIIVFLPVLSSMFFDNLLDYSAVWVITICWLLFISSITVKKLNT